MSHSTSISIGSEVDQKKPIVHYLSSDLENSWKNADSDWGHSLHSFAPFVGSFPPELAYYFIRRFTNVGDRVLDPFCGCGTVPLEAAIHNREAIGSDLFTYAYVLSRAKCNPLSDGDFIRFLEQKLAATTELDESTWNFLENDDLHVFYSDYTLQKLLRLREVLTGDQSQEAHYLKAIICAILHGPSDLFLSLQMKDMYSGTTNYVRKYAERNNLSRPERDIKSRALRKHRLIQKDYIPKWISERTTILQSDARNLPFTDSNVSFAEGSVDLVLTSPPYMAKLDYTWNNWLRLWWLDVNRKQEQSNLVMTQDIERYEQFITLSLQNMYDALGSDGVAVLIIGDVTKRLANGRQTINTAHMIEQLARENTNFEPHSIIVDDYGIDNRSFVSFNQVKYEHSDEEKREFAELDRCLILTKGNPEMDRDTDINWECEPYRLRK